MNIERKKRIAIITPYGGESRLDNYAEFNLAQGLIAKGWEVRMYTYAARGIPGYVNDLNYKGIPVYRTRYRLGVSPRLFLLLLGFKPGTIIGFHPKNFLNFTAYHAAKLLGARFIIQIVGLLHDPYFVEDTDDPIGKLRPIGTIITNTQELFKRIFSLNGNPVEHWKNYVLHIGTKNADKILAMNKNEMIHIESVYGKTSELVYWCAPRERGTEHEKKPNVELPERYLYFIGQIKKRKGWDTAIDTISELKKRGIIKYLVFQSPFSDVRIPATYAEEKGVREQIIFLTVTTDERDWLYRHSDYVLIPSRYEGFGIPVFEAFLAGRPICVTDINTFQEFLINKENAMMTKMEDGKAMAESVMALDSDPELREKLILGGKNSLDVFSVDHMVLNFLKAIESTQTKN